MANTVRLKRSAVAGKVPLTTDLALGEIAINTRDGKIYIKQSDGTTDTIVEVGSGGGDPDFVTTKRVIDDDFTLPTGRNMLSINDVTVSNGVTVEVPAGHTWIVIG